MAKLISKVNHVKIDLPSMAQLSLSTRTISKELSQQDLIADLSRMLEEFFAGICQDTNMDEMFGHLTSVEIQC